MPDFITSTRPGGGSNALGWRETAPGRPAEILITFDDLRELQALLARELEHCRFRSVSLLAPRLNEARVVPSAQIPPGCMTMHASARYRDEASGVVQECTLVYPGHQRSSHKLVAVTSELGAALLGLSVGMRASWVGLRGARSIELLEILHQPEWALTGFRPERR